MSTDFSSGPLAIVRARNARSWLFVPGHRHERFAKAAASSADIVVCDLEDAVADDAKAAARAEVARWLTEGGSECVRINAHGSPHYDSDVTALINTPVYRRSWCPRSRTPVHSRSSATR